MNAYFPKWHTASTIIIDDIINKFGVYVKRNEEDESVLQITFIPPEIFYAVPEEDRELFVEIYNVFANWVYETLAIDEIFQKHHGRPITNESLYSLQHDIERAIHEFNNMNYIEMQEVLAACLGERPTLILPIELVNRLARG